MTAPPLPGARITRAQLEAVMHCRLSLSACNSRARLGGDLDPGPRADGQWITQRSGDKTASMANTMGAPKVNPGTRRARASATRAPEGRRSRIVPPGPSGPFEHRLIARGDIERDGQLLGGDPVPPRTVSRHLGPPHQGPELRKRRAPAASPARSAQFGTKRAEYMPISLSFNGAGLVGTGPVCRIRDGRSTC
jgi:hypothetical protein